MARRYAGDPYWLTLKYPGQCARCGRELRKGERAFRYKSGALYCDSAVCGRAESRSFEAAAEDEDRYCSDGPPMDFDLGDEYF